MDKVKPDRITETVTWKPDKPEPGKPDRITETVTWKPNSNENPAKDKKQ